jgi:L-amino acid N-acyltransferase YncA
MTRPGDQVTVRAATEAEVRSVAEIHVRGWQWAYRGKVPDHILDGLSVERREAMWRGAVRNPGERRVWVADRDGRICGFVATEPSRDTDAAPRIGEVTAIYIEEAVAGTGVGRALATHALNDLQTRGFLGAVWWVLETNDRTRRWLERAGWQPDGATKSEDAGSFELKEVRYGSRSADRVSRGQWAGNKRYGGARSSSTDPSGLLNTGRPSSSSSRNPPG